MTTPETPSFRSGSRATPIEPAKYPALEALRQHCYRDSITLLDRVYAEAQALHKRALEAETELELILGKRAAVMSSMDKNSGEELL